ncbi:hypothetical protein SAMN05216275_12177 [Streptosporangium canum]|uniref:Uncharacterized protein n=1 Tax=Streptosporangium canum TaxID=324952 RepID=A0A1I3Y863_9ACTN|nr:hypothetical protein SAMN05216275_12177 [Streptosporangium canum]
MWPGGAKGAARPAISSSLATSGGTPDTAGA